MMIVQPDLGAVRDALAQESDRLVGAVRAAPALDRRAPGLAWTTGQLVAHLCAMYGAFAATLRGEQFDPGIAAVAGTGRALPEIVAEVNASAIGQISFTGAAQAAEALAGAAADLLATLDAGLDPLAECPTPWYGATATRTAGALAALSVSESLIHGYDLAGALGTTRRMDERSAAAVVPTVMTAMMPLLVNPAGARDFTGAFEIRIRGAQPFVLTVDGGTARAQPADTERVDCVISLTACAALLVGFRRQPLWRAVLSGASMAYGRRPWLGLRFPSLFVSV
jgi:hypothetical protein